MQRIGGEHHASQAQGLDQPRRRRDLAGGAGHLTLGEDERGLGGEGAQHMRGRLIVHMVEAAPERFAVQGYRTQTCLRHRSDEVTCVAAEGGFEIGRSRASNRLRRVFSAGARRNRLPKTGSGARDAPR